MEATFDRDFWEHRWDRVARDHPEAVANRPPNAHVITELADVRPGVALDAGCGHGAEAHWLSAAGWRVTAVDFSPTALDVGRSTARRLGADIAERIEWREGDLATWSPPQRHYDLVVCLYVHIAGSVAEFVTRLARGVAAGGTLLLVGHRPVDPETGADTAAAGQVQVSVEETAAALDALGGWRIDVAEERRRAAEGSGVDAVIRAVAPE
ncbi:class I SAM-dependent methyltransferase [Prauserella halophila]|uniref:Class I SAM-dependent methyltransferase n=1 Tax=Prauserella halophila TaxID=185641 RepID=A0ABP4GVL8_9PSEU|nr:class I SAM-dependent methyltransferase [Prauserella halophila]MCP2234989.1 Methyltransferase domain-containing protein [Prauserella halophila]